MASAHVDGFRKIASTPLVRILITILLLTVSALLVRVPDVVAEGTAHHCVVHAAGYGHAAIPTIDAAIASESAESGQDVLPQLDCMLTRTGVAIEHTREWIAVPNDTQPYPHVPVFIQTRTLLI